MLIILFARGTTIPNSTFIFMCASGSPSENPNSSSLFLFGHVIHTDFISSQPLQLQMDRLEILNDIQRLFGNINWVCSFIEIPAAVFKLLYDIPHGDPNPRSPWKLTHEAKDSLALTGGKLNSQSLLCRLK